VIGHVLAGAVNLEAGAVNLEVEAQAEQETGMDDAAWMRARFDQLEAVPATGRLPRIARFIDSGRRFDLDLLLDFGLQRLLDGLTPMVSSAAASSPSGATG
jgi:hypothetical protein